MITTAMDRADFASRLYARLATAQSDQDLFLSPFGIQVALAMCALGARGETRKVLADLIGAPASVDDQNRQYAALLKSLDGAASPHVELDVANALWVQQGLRLHSDYRKVVAELYQGGCNELDFRQPDQTAKTINGWVEGKTHGKIKDLLDRQLVSEDTRLILTNAIYFKGKWESPFDENHTQDEDWHGDGGVRKVPMMRQNRGYAFCEQEDFQALDLPYQGGHLSMLVVLPRKKDGLAALETKWAADTYRQVASSLAYENTVVVSLPRFSAESELRLRPVLSAMGAALAFGAGADFGGICAEPLSISEVIHKTLIEVNEEGTQATAAAGVVMSKGFSLSEPKRFRADHPFLFMIRDTNTSAILFWGRVSA